MSKFDSSLFEMLTVYEGKINFISKREKFSEDYILKFAEDLKELSKVGQGFESFIGSDDILVGQAASDVQLSWIAKSPLPPSVHIGSNFSESTNFSNGQTAYMTGSGASASACLYYSDKDFGTDIPAVAGATYQLRGLFATHRALGRLKLTFLDEERKPIGGCEELLTEHKAGGQIEDWKQVDTHCTAPQGTKYLQINICFVRSYNAIRDMNFFIFFNSVSLKIVWTKKGESNKTTADGWTRLILSILSGSSTYVLYSAEVDVEKINAGRPNIYLVNRENDSDQTLVYDPNSIFDFSESEIKFENGRFLSIKINMPIHYIVYCDNRPIASGYHQGHHHTHVKLPDNLLDGNAHLFDVRDATGITILARDVFIVPYMSTPWYILQEHAAPFPPSALAPAAVDRYRALQAHLANGVGGDLQAQLFHAHQVLVLGFNFNKDFRPLRFPQDRTPKVSIIIPVHNKFEVTYFCLCALLVAHNKSPYEIIVVDDGSTDKTKQLASYVDGIKIIRNEVSLGFIGACNKGAESAEGEYVVFLNNDTEPTIGWLDELLDSFAIFDKVGLAGSKLVYPDGTLQEAGGIVWGSGNPWNYGRSQNPHEPRFAYSREADYLSGAAIMLPKSVWDEVGGFSTEFMPAYFEDTDLAFKIRAHGYKTYYVASSVVYHFEGVTSGVDVSGGGAKRHQEINRPKFKRKWVEDYRLHGREGVNPDLEKDRGIHGRALFVDYQTPKVDTDAGSYAAVQEIRLVQALGYKVSFLSQNLAYLGKHTEYLQRIGVEVYHAPFYQSIEDVFEKHGKDFDVVYMTRYYVARSCVAAARRYAPQAKLVMNNADLHFLREMRTAIASNDRALMGKALTVRNDELSVMQDVDLVLSYNSVEHAVIMSHNPDSTRVMHAPWVEKISNNIPPFEARSDVAFLGGFNHHPNREAVEFFVLAVMPLLRQKSDMHLKVYGSNPSKEVYQLASDDVIVHGYVENVNVVFDNCRVFVAPLVSGAGIKGKVLAALAHGTPCVLSPIAAEGIGLRHGYDCFIAETPADWVEYIMRLYTNADLWLELSNRGRNLINEVYSFEAGRAKMRSAFESLSLYTPS
ncbi:Glycosyltransferase, GT2 family [Methylobacterium sp. 174MFSha1.1]|uniref:glycosyltransferase n=1 Tax=Methylobacterium sp. 174MFSha1.1 TaxID=1502749 RepID=UPI0008E4F729|nr:glycosyltransferase [Methylobacterium sp. 174MFSha1.1]SFV09278.1 Glycosyltransferase, GT2 family [Methylobacterium sp. 174MFSha1.1]